jgi:N-carbamoylputrescine amidase
MLAPGVTTILVAMTTSRSVRVGLVQQRAGGDPAGNFDRAVEGIRSAVAQGAQIICLQELFGSYYFCQREDHDFFKLAEAIPGPSTDRLSAIAKELGVVIVASLFERRAQGLYHNTAAVIDADGSYLGKYRKMHIPDDPQFHEKFYFTPGDLGFRTWKTRFGKIGVLICWDQWYPEAARLMALAGAELLLYPTAIGWDPDDVADEQARQREAWILSHRGHAVANGLPVLSCNRIGHEPSPLGASGIRFWGSSLVLGPQGELLAEAGTQAPELLLAQVDLARSEQVRRIWPFLRDRRIDAYQDLLRRYRD